MGNPRQAEIGLKENTICKIFSRLNFQHFTYSTTESTGSESYIHLPKAQWISNSKLKHFLFVMDGQLLPPSLYTVKGIAILDNDGNRILSNYYDSELFASIKEEKAFEKNLFSKTSKASGEIIMLDGLTCLYRSNVDLYFYVMGSTHENELLLMSVLNCVYESVSQILRKNVERRALFDALDVVMLAIDEIVDGGIVLESDPNAVVNRVALRSDDIPLGEQTVAQVLQSAKEQIKWSLLK